MKFLITFLGLTLVQSPAHASLREDVRNKKFICDEGVKDIETWLWFDAESKRVFFYNYNAEYIKLKWKSNRVNIVSLYAQDTEFWFEFKNGKYEYAGMVCREVNDLAIAKIPKNRFLNR